MSATFYNSSNKPTVRIGNDQAEPIYTQTMGNIMEYYGKSTDTKPTQNVKVGSTFLEIDTKQVYIFDGSIWVVF